MPNPKRFEEKKKQLDNLCGDEFEIIEPYTAANNPIVLRHNKCGKVITYKQCDTILRNNKINCSCTKHSRKYTQEAFEQKIHDICPDLKVLSPYTVSYEKVRFLYIPDNVEFEATPRAIYLKEGYPFNINSNTQLIKGVNDMWTTRPDIAKYLKNSEDGFIYKYGVNKALEFKCPDCGTIFTCIPNRLFGVSGKVKCPCCQDGVSYPEKIMCSLLTLLGIKYIWQYTKNRGGDIWCKDYRYDFYLCDYNIILEVNGMQHYEEGFNNHTLYEIQNTDKLKKELALNNGISDYIIIDARFSEFDWIKENICKSKLKDYLSLDSVDWIECKNMSIKTKLLDIANDWNNNIPLNQLPIKYQVDRHTIRKYLLKCEDLGLLTRSYINNTKKSQHPVQCVETGQIFKTIKDAQIFCNPNVNPNGSRIAIVLDKDNKTAYGCHWINYK